LADAVLAETCTTRRRLRLLPGRVGVSCVLALSPFGQVSYAGAWGMLVAALIGLPGLDVACPSEKALRNSRRRVAAAPTWLMRSTDHETRPIRWQHLHRADRDQSM
jgi:hypothetical protein